MGKFERKICLQQKYLYSTLCSQLTQEESHTEHSFLATLMVYKP
jgi:hypothetical protein